jgi:hypothetical protein
MPQRRPCLWFSDANYSDYALIEERHCLPRFLGGDPGQWKLMSKKLFHMTDFRTTCLLPWRNSFFILELFIATSVLIHTPLLMTPLPERVGVSITHRRVF